MGYKCIFRALDSNALLLVPVAKVGSSKDIMRDGSHFIHEAMPGLKLSSRHITKGGRVMLNELYEPEV